MILACPACLTRFLVNPTAFADGPRRVRCGKCGQEWLAEPPTDPIPPPAEPVEPPPEAVKPIPKGSNLPVLPGKDYRKFLRWGVMGTAAAAFLALLVWGIAGALSGDLPIIGEKAQFAEVEAALTLQDIRSEQRLENGAIMLFVEGRIINNGKKEYHVPPLKIAAMGADNDEITSWEIRAEPAKLLPGGMATFSSSVLYPQESVAEVTLSFIDEHAKERNHE